MSPPTVPQATHTNFIQRLVPSFREGDHEAERKSLEANHVQLLTEAYQAIAQGDYGPLAAMLHDDIEMEFLGAAGMPMVGKCQGSAQALETIRRNFAMIDHPETQILSVIAQGDTVILMAHERGILRKTGRPYHTHWTQSFTFRDNKLFRFRGMYDNAGMLAAMPPETVTNLIASWQGGNTPAAHQP